MSKYKILGVLCSVAVTFFGVYLFVWAGSIDSPALPSSDSGRMYTLEQIYQRFYTGTSATKQSGGFAEPGSAPGSTMHTLDNIYNDFGTDITATSGTVAADVLSGKTFFATSGTTRGTSWGPTSGTIANCSSEGGNACYAATGKWTSLAGSSNTNGTAGSLTVTIPQGYYSGTETATANDASNLVAGNIKSTATIFGTAGTFKALLPTTAQVLCYDTDGLPAIACGGVDWPDQDADASGDSGACTPTYAQGTYTVTDSCTNLEWQRYGHGSDNGYTVPAAAGDCDLYGGTYGASYCTYTWQNALKYCSGLSLDDHGDWRLPNAKELQSIVKYSVSVPAIDTTKFSSTKSDYYWSSTTYATSPAFAWSVGFFNGDVYSDGKTSGHDIRCVRQY